MRDLKKAFYHFTLLCKRLLLALILFGLLRVIFLCFNASIISNVGIADVVQSFIAGVVFDLSAITYLFSVFILLHLVPLPWRDSNILQLFLKYFFLSISFICILLNLIDTGYYAFSNRRSGIELLKMKQEVSDSVFVYLYSYWHLLLLFGLLMFGLYKFYPKHHKQPSEKADFKLIGYELIVLLFSAGLFFLTARGGWGLKPVNTFDAARIAHVKLLPLTINTPFQFLVTSQQQGLLAKNYFEAKEAEKYFNPIHVSNASDTLSQPQNIVLIILESFGKEYVGYYNKGKISYTPFLDSLCKHSCVYTHAYANAKRSIEGIPAIVASMPSLMNSDYIGSTFQSNVLHGIGSYLDIKGYDCSFYHGGKNGTMSFDNFIAITHSGKYYGMSEYPEKDKDFDGTWGIFDKPYLHYFASELSKKSRPFFSTVFTLSSHHPYHIPDSDKNKYHKGTLPIHASIQYADDALRNFFKEISHFDWYRNTRFIITADHSAENENPYYQTLQGRYEIPLLIFEPTNNRPSIIHHTTQQCDILPMIVGTTHQKYFAFSNYGSSHAPFAIQYTDGIYQLIQYPYVYHFDGTNALALYNVLTDSLMQHNMIQKQSSRAMQMDTLLKCIIQTYDHALNDNTTYVR